MIKIEVELNTDDKKEVPEIMKEIAEKVSNGIDMSNGEKYRFRLVDEK